MKSVRERALQELYRRGSQGHEDKNLSYKKKQGLTWTCTCGQVNEGTAMYCCACGKAHVDNKKQYPWWKRLAPSRSLASSLIVLEVLGSVIFGMVGIHNIDVAKAASTKSEKVEQVQREPEKKEKEKAPEPQKKTEDKTKNQEKSKSEAKEKKGGENALNKSTALTQADAKQAAQTFEAYHKAISDGDIQKAYSYFDDDMKNQVGSYSDFASGYTHTVDSTIVNGDLVGARDNQLVFEYALSSTDRINGRYVRQNFKGHVLMTLYNNRTWKISSIEAEKI